MAAYYEGHPDPDDATTWGADSEGHPYTDFEDARDAFAAAKGPAPTPSPVPGAASPGAGMPAARIGDICAHGGPVTGPGEPTVLIGGSVAVRGIPLKGDTVACPMFNALVPHATGTIIKGSNTVWIGGLPAARVADPVGPPTVCAGNQIAVGCFTVLIGDAGGGGAGGPGGAASGHASLISEVAEPEPAYADTQAAEQPPGESPVNVGTGTHFISIEMVDEAEQPVIGEQYSVRIPDRPDPVCGGLDDKGTARIHGITKPGTCAIAFPRLDLAAWERWKSANAQPTGGAAPPPTATGQPTEPVIAGPAARSGTYRTIMAGECVSSIARDTGHFWRTIWDHPSNAKLVQHRGNPNVLMAKDSVFVPEKRPKEESGATDQHHKFRRKGEPSRFRLQVMLAGKPRVDKPYQIWVDEKSPALEGVTDAEGMIDVPIPGNARSLRIAVGSPGYEMYYHFVLGALEPLDTIRGIQHRLFNLGWGYVQINGKLDEMTQEAIREFQMRNGLDATGEPDSATSSALRDAHGG